MRRKISDMQGEKNLYKKSFKMFGDKNEEDTDTEGEGESKREGI